MAGLLLAFAGVTAVIQPSGGVDRDRARDVGHELLHDAAHQIDRNREAQAFFDQRLAYYARGVAYAAKKLGGRVALKALAPGLIRKSDAGAVRLDLEGAHEVEEAAKGSVRQTATLNVTVNAYSHATALGAGSSAGFGGMAQDQTGERGLACPRWAPKDERAKFVFLDADPQRLASP